MPTKKQPEPQLISPPLDQEVQQALNKYEETTYASLIAQVETEYKLAWWFMKPKLDEWALRLKLYNNQKRNKEAVGDPLLFTIHQTVLASLYSDRLAVDFSAREDGDEETAENLNSLADFDYDEMEKDELDYEWDWDASFFGRGLLLEMEFDRKLKCPVPEVVDMMTWLRDPRAKSVNGDRKGRNAMKFGGREIRLTQYEMDQAGIYFNTQGLKQDSRDLSSFLDKGTQARAEAQGRGDVEKWDALVGDNADFRLLEWFTHWKGKKVLVTLGDNRKRVVRYTELGASKWPIIDRCIYPIAHDWDNVSIPDLTEDKQRAKAVVQNLSLQGIKLGLHPTYLYDSNKIKNRGNLNVDFNKHIPVDGTPAGAIEAVSKSVVKQEANWILELLDSAAQRATATPDIQQGIQAENKRTATELNLQTSKVDTRYGLSAKIFGWSEKRFWKQYYSLYKEHFADGIDEKVIRITGAMGSRWRKLTRENIIANTDPDVKVESKAISDAVKFNELQKYRLFFKDVIATDPQNSNIRAALRRIGSLSGFRKDEVDQILPPTVDEMNAEAENVKLDAGTRVDVNVYDDDLVHMEVHNKAADTPEKYAHINAHKMAMMLKKARPEFNTATRPANPLNPTEAATAPGVGFMNTAGAGGVAGASTASPAGRSLPVGA